MHSMLSARASLADRHNLIYERRKRRPLQFFDSSRKSPAVKLSLPSIRPPSAGLSGWRQEQFTSCMVFRCGCGGGWKWREVGLGGVISNSSVVALVLWYHPRYLGHWCKIQNSFSCRLFIYLPRPEPQLALNHTDNVTGNE